MPGAEALTRDLVSAGLRLAVATSSSRRFFDLKTTRHRAWFDAVFSAVLVGDDPRVAAGKPAPDIFLCAAAALGAEPRDCAVVEDAPVGVRAARAAGMQSRRRSLSRHGPALDSRTRDLLAKLSRRAVGERPSAPPSGARRPEDHDDLRARRRLGCLPALAPSGPRRTGARAASALKERRMRSRRSGRLEGDELGEPCDDPVAILGRAILAELPLAHEARQAHLDADDAAEHRGDEVARRIGHVPRLGARRLVPSGEPLRRCSATTRPPRRSGFARRRARQRSSGRDHLPALALARIPTRTHVSVRPLEDRERVDVWRRLQPHRIRASHVPERVPRGAGVGSISIGMMVASSPALDSRDEHRERMVAHEPVEDLGARLLEVLRDVHTAPRLIGRGPRFNDHGA